MPTPTTVPWTIVGVDCASQDKHIGLACGTLGADNKLRILEVSAGPGPDRSIVDLLAGWLLPHPRVLLAIDAPLGWPRRLTESLQMHRAGEPLLEPKSTLLVRRMTDLRLRTLGHQPLDVGADRIAYAAHRALRLLGELRQATGRALPLLWPPASDSGAIEVYPAATMRARNLITAGYKKNAARATGSTNTSAGARLMKSSTGCPTARAKAGLTKAIRPWASKRIMRSSTPSTIARSSASRLASASAARCRAVMSRAITKTPVPPCSVSGSGVKRA